MDKKERKYERSSSKFFVTFPQTDIDKQFVYEMFKDDCEAMVVSQEQHHDGNNHLHMYIVTKEKTRLSPLREYIVRSISVLSDDDLAIDIQCVRDERRVLTYVTKDDDDPVVYNVDTGRLHYSYQLASYIKTHRTFNAFDPFIRKHHTMINCIRTSHSDYWSKVELNLPSPFDSRVVNWDIGWVKKVLSCVERRHNFVLHGYSGTGKTTVVLQAVHKYFNKADICHLPCGDSSFEFSNVQSSTKCIIAGEAGEQYLITHRANILRIADGSPFTVNPKYERLRTIAFTGLFVIVSNYDLLQESRAPEFKRRFTSIQACRKAVEEKDLSTEEDYYEAENFPSSPII